MKFSLIISQDTGLLEQAFLEGMKQLKRKGLSVHFSVSQEKNHSLFGFSTEENPNENTYLLPIMLSSIIARYIIYCREETWIQYLFSKKYLPLEPDIARKTLEHFFMKERKHHRLNLVFFPLINYFNGELPSVTWNMEGFLLFHLKNYHTAFHEDLIISLDEALSLMEEDYREATEEALPKLTLLKGGKI